MLPDAAGQLTRPHRAPTRRLTVDIGIAQWAFDQGQPAGFGTDTLPGSEVLYIPLRAPTHARGVLAVKARNRRLLRIPEQRQLLDTFAALDRHCAGARALRRSRAGCAGADGIGAPAQFAAGGAVA